MTAIPQNAKLEQLVEAQTEVMKQMLAELKEIKGRLKESTPNMHDFAKLTR